MSLPSSLPGAFGSEMSFTTLLGAEGAEAEESMTTPVPSHRKPDRLAVACKQCRKRKVRCDAQQPRCKNCTFQGGSSIQSLFTFVDLHLAIHGFDPASPLFRHGMHESEEIPLSLLLKLPPLPNHQKIKQCLDVFFDRLWPFYPVVNRSTFEAEIDAIISQQPQEVSDLQFSIQHTHIPCLVAVYCMVCIGINELSSADSELSIEYLNAGYQLYAHLVATPYLPSAQSLFLLALALRSWGKDGQAWHIVGQAIRVSQSLGLHKLVMRHTPVKAQGTPYQHSDTLGERLWWSCYALEKQMQLECGRPSIIDTEFDNIAPIWSRNSATSDSSSPYFKAWVSLAGIMGRISDRIYSHKFGNAEEMLSETIKLDKNLLEWESSLPDSLRPRDIFLEHLDEASKICAGFLSQQYYHAQISALRVSLIFPQHVFSAEIKRHGKKLSQTQRLLAGASICAQAARAVATQILQLADGNVRSPCLGISQTFLASVVLALVILRQPNSRLARSDVELLTSTTEHMEAWYYHCGFNPGFIQVFVELRNRVGSVFLKTSSKPLRRSSSIATSLSRPQDIVSQGSGLTPSMAGSYGHTSTTPNHGGALSGMGNQGTGDGFDDSALNFFGNMDFEELWNMMDSDFMSYDTDIQLIPS
ncbi:unnamed protein product [Clonostachys rosea]|uniref:Zn(2)-C6 fungal-type domain-containing protein n=1 Tax=Bionectria ochroleuca TaxID=29856 RepID=A0ABY6U0K1_BIOOC|nr:unnamed protein product [Clonostachys rosea]